MLFWIILVYKFLSLCIWYKILLDKDNDLYSNFFVVLYSVVYNLLSCRIIFVIIGSDREEMN